MTRSGGDVIHSGHFMISSVTDQDDIDDEVSHDRDSPVHHDQALRLREGYDFSQVMKETQNTYQFGHRPTNHITIDASLSRLFECMSLAYRGGKVVSPKWKNFKGMRLSVKDKIRLNNAIWRTWHIQYIMNKRRSKISFVQFATPLDSESDCDSHSKPEAVVMEGKYWKRRIETVVAEYKKWRAFFMEKLRQSEHPGLTWVSPNTPEAPLFDPTRVEDDFNAERLLSCLSQPQFQFPNPREIAQHATNSDMMQPGLLQLQPMIEDFMDPMENFHDLFGTSRKNNSNVSLFYAGPNFQSSPQGNDFANGLIMQQDLSTCTSSGLQETSLEELVQTANMDQNPNTMCQNQLDVEMSQMPPLRPQHDHVMQQNNINFGVSDPMLTPVADKMFNHGQRNNERAPVPMMISKQQQLTPTISQIVTAHTPHHHGTTYKAHPSMPPPQKKAPRRKSGQNRTMNDTLTPRGNLNQNMVHMQQQQNTQPQPNSHNFKTVPQIAQVPMQIVQNQAQINSTPATTPQQVILTTNMGNFAISSQATYIPVDKMVHSSPMTSINVQTVDRDMIIDSINANNNMIQSNSIMRKDIVTQTAPVLTATAPRQQNTPSQGSFDQPPRKQLLIADGALSNVEIQVQSTQPGHNSQQHSILTQLLQTGIRPTGPAKASPQLQVPSNSPFICMNQTQLRKVQEQAQNFSTFQNSVVMAAAQLAATPQSHHVSVTTQQQPVTVQSFESQNRPQQLLSHHQASPANIMNQSATNAPEQHLAPKPSFIGSSFEGAKTLDKGKQSNAPPWPTATITTIHSMDTDEVLPSETMSFAKTSLSEQTQKVSTQAPTSPSASLSPGSAAEQRTTEQIRRCNMKSFFKRLQDMLPDFSSNPNPKASKAVVLGKSCKYIRDLQNARQRTDLEIQKMKKEIKELNEEISNMQQQLPVTGAPVCRKHGERMSHYFEEWVRERTMHNWKFYIFSMIIRPWFSTYDQTVSIASLEELCKTCLMWLEKSCSLPSLRRSVVNSLQELSTTTSILSDPSNLQQQAENAVQQNSRSSSNASLS